MVTAKRHAFYGIWSAMKSRCYDENSKSYKDYGGRGIKVCDKWRDNFDAFVTDMGPKPTPKHSIDRIDVNGDYEPSNCRWATPKEQSNNRRNNRLFTYNGLTLNITQWAEKLGIPAKTMQSRLSVRGFSIEKAMKYELPLVEFDGKRLRVSEWAKLYNIKASTIHDRLYNGWTPERAISTPVSSYEKSTSIKSKPASRREKSDREKQEQLDRNHKHIRRIV